jgi:hypothetical protein
LANEAALGRDLSSSVLDLDAVEDVPFLLDRVAGRVRAGGAIFG